MSNLGSSWAPGTWASGAWRYGTWVGYSLDSVVIFLKRAHARFRGRGYP